MIKKIKIFSFIFAIAMCFVASNNTYAEETYTVDEQLAIDKLAATKVMIGTDAGFEGKSNLTRAQAAAIMVRIKGVSEDTVERKNKL